MEVRRRRYSQIIFDERNLSGKFSMNLDAASGFSYHNWAWDDDETSIDTVIRNPLGFRRVSILSIIPLKKRLFSKHAGALTLCHSRHAASLDSIMKDLLWSNWVRCSGLSGIISRWSTNYGVTKLDRQTIREESVSSLFLFDACRLPNRLNWIQCSKQFSMM